MFSGIVSNIGKIASIEKNNNGKSFSILCDYPTEQIQLGSSILCSGICMTVTQIQKAQSKTEFSIDASQETLKVTHADSWQQGDEINLELSLKIGDEISGHLVFGHIDGLAKITNIQNQNPAKIFTLKAQPEIIKLIALKGSITIDGVSLTINSIQDDSFSVTIIPYTLKNTTFQNRKINDKCAIEIDMLMRYVARLNDTQSLPANLRETI